MQVKTYCNVLENLKNATNIQPIAKSVVIPVFVVESVVDVIVLDVTSIDTGFGVLIFTLARSKKLKR